MAGGCTALRVSQMGYEPDPGTSARLGFRAL